MSVLIFAAMPAFSAQTTWSGTGVSGAWSDAAKWSEGVPVADSFATISNSGTVTISSEVPGTYEWLFLGAHVMGPTGNNVLTIQGGFLAGTTSTIGASGGIGAGPGTGTVNVNSGTWINTGDLWLGAGNLGVLNLSGGYINGGTVVIGRALNTDGVNFFTSGSATVASGTLASNFLVVGQDGTGHLAVNGGLVSANITSIGTSPMPMSGGHVTIAAGGTLSTGMLRLGSLAPPSFFGGGNGFLTINGGMVTAEDAAVGDFGTGTSSVVVNSGTWVTSGTLVVGNMANGSATFNGGLVSSSRASIGHGPTGPGVVSISGGTWNNAYNLDVGYMGSGTLQFSGGELIASKVMAGVTGEGSRGSIIVSGGTLSGVNEFVIGNVGAGDLRVTGGVLSTGTTMVGALGSIFSSPAAEGIVTVTGGVWSSTITWIGMSGNGTLNVDGGLANTYFAILGNSASSSGVANVSSGTWFYNQMNIGYQGSGSISITGGLLAGGSALVGTGSGGSGQVTITGGTWTGTGADPRTSMLRIGNSDFGGSGKVSVEGGLVDLGYIVLNNADSGILVSAGTMSGGMLVVGSGSLAQSGGLVDFGMSSIGAGAATHGIATVSGGTMKTILTVGAQVDGFGNGGTGEFFLQGGLVEGNMGSVGDAPGSNGTATVSGGTWNVAHTLSMGAGGVAALNVQGGLVNSGSFINAHANSSILVSGGTLQTRQLNLGWAGQGTLEIEGDGVVAVSEGALVLGAGETGLGILNFGDGGTLLASQVRSGAGLGVVNFNHGGTGNFDYSFQGRLALNKRGTGLSNLLGENVFNQGFNIHSGTLAVVSGASIDGGGTSVLVGFDAADDGTLVIAGHVGAGSAMLGGNGSGAGTVRVNGGSWDQSDFFAVGYTGTGHFFLDGGRVASLFTLIGDVAGSEGVATQSSGTWTNQGGLVAGHAGNGSFTLEGGLLTADRGIVGNRDTSVGVATLRGGEWRNATGMWVGNSGEGIFTMSGGVLTNRAESIIGHEAGSYGTVTLSGGVWTNTTTMWVGNSGTAIFTMTGGLVTNGGDTVVARQAGSYGVLHVNGGTWNTGGNIIVSGTHHSAGSFNINGGHVTAQSMSLSNGGTASSGNFLIEGGSLALSGDLTIGLHGSADFRMYGGSVSVAGNTYLGYWDANMGLGLGAAYGLAQLTGGSLVTSGTMYVGYWNDAEFIITQGLVSNDFGVIANYLQSDGITHTRSTGTVTMYGGTWNNASGLHVGRQGEATLAVKAGVVRVGAGSGTMHVAYDTGSIGTLEIGNATIDAAEIMGGHQGQFVLEGGKAAVLVNNSGSITIAPRFTGSLEFSKRGVGTAVLTGSSAFWGDVVIHQGTLAVAGGALGNPSTFLPSTSQMRIGLSPGDNGALVLSGGYISSDGAFLGSDVDSAGSATVNSGTWHMASSLYIGATGTGVLNVNGGLVSNYTTILASGSASHGTAVVNGGTWSMSDHLVVGSYSTASLTINDGLVSNKIAYLGAANLAGMLGVGHVAMTGGEWRNNAVMVGSSGSATLAISGGLVTAVGSQIGVEASSNGTVIVSGGTWAATGDPVNAIDGFLYVGTSGTARLTIAGGLVDVNGNTTVGLASSANAILMLSGSNGSHGVLETNQVVKGLGTATLNFDGGGIRASTDQANFFSGFATASVGAGGAYFDTNGYNVGMSTVLLGSGGIVKQGQGTLTLTTANAIEGASLVTGGTLAVNNSLSLGDGGVRVEGGTLLIAQGVDISNHVTLAGGTLAERYAGGASLAGALQVTSNFSGGKPDTSAVILAGTLSGNATLTAGFSAGLPDRTNSDILHLTGIPIVASGTVTDIFVLEMSMSAVSPGSYLAWLNDEGKWVNAALGNTGNNASGGQLGYAGSFSQFQADSENGYILSSYIGAWGFTNTSVWAVLNHNSDFSVVPEPSTALLVGAAAAVLAVSPRRRRII